MKITGLSVFLGRILKIIIQLLQGEIFYLFHSNIVHHCLYYLSASHLTPYSSYYSYYVQRKEFLSILRLICYIYQERFQRLFVLIYARATDLFATTHSLLQPDDIVCSALTSALPQKLKDYNVAIYHYRSGFLR